ncbi:MAG: ABC-2 family transporter protein [Actinomycetota bacterium]
MRLLWEVALRSFRRAGSYRMATAAGVFVNTVFGYLKAYVLIAVAVANGGSVAGWTLQEVATFAFVGQGFLAAIGAFGDPELADRVRSGQVVVDLYRPVDLQLWWLAGWYGKVVYQVLFRGIPPVVLGALAIDLRWPDPWWHWAAFAVALVAATTIGFALRFCTNLVTFWLLDNRGVDQLITLSLAFFSGLLLPLALFPPAVETVARALPFAALVQLPVEIYLGRHGPAGVAWILLQQVMWLVALLLAGRVLLTAATRKVVIQGG